MSLLLADTGPLYALVDPDDRHHARASEQLALLTTLHFEVVIPHPIAMESHTLILRKLGGATAQRWLGEIELGARFVNPTADDYEDAKARTRRYPDQMITLFDSLLATLSERLGIPVWTYNFHFDVMRAEVWREA